MYDKLQKTIRIKAKTSLMVQTVVGNEDMKDEEIIDNIQTVYDQLTHSLVNHENNVKAVYLKLTMSKPVRVA